jgi:putative colanic acid biosynthesis UDP-glucose lipid carrier transferase
MKTGFLQTHSTWMLNTVRTLDFVVVLLLAWLVFHLKFGWTVIMPNHYVLASGLGALFTFTSMQLGGAYQPMRGSALWRIVPRMVWVFVLVALALTLCVFFTRTGLHFSRQWLGEWMFSSFVVCTLYRISLLFLLRSLRKQGLNVRRVVMIGSGALALEAVKTIHAAAWAGYKIVKVLDDQNLKQKTVKGIALEPLPENLEGLLKGIDVHEVWIALPLSQAERIKEITHHLRFSTVNVRLLPGMFGLDLLNHSVTEVAGFPIVNLRATPMQGGSRVLKSLEDKLLSLFILICISPVMLVLAVWVKVTSKGPVFYRQERITWNNRSFGMLKFRSMPVNAESKTGAVWAVSGENRATKIGAFMRKTSLDELPQFINVLKGDMSIVGPRPERPVFVEKFKYDVPGYMQKHMMKAGITGWAQINGWRGDTDLAKRIECDLYYIENWSVWFDIKIVFLTIFKGFINKNAY